MSQFKTLVTAAGAAKIAAALAGTGTVTLSSGAKMAIGDGNGKLPVPSTTQTALVNEVYRAPINAASIDARDGKNIIAELIIPPEKPDKTGFWMREMALYDAEGDLLAVGNMAETYKPSLSEGAGRKMVIRMVIAVSDVSAVTITLDTTTVMATQDYVDNKLDVHEKSRRHPDATLTDKGFTQLNSATDSTLETQAATPKAVKSVMDVVATKAPLVSPAMTGTPTAPTAPAGTNTEQLANTAFVRAAIAAMINSSPAALDTLGELAAALGNDPNFATTITNLLAGKQPLDATLTALAGLNTWADRLPYFTGVDTANVTPLTSTGRELIGQADSDSTREYLSALGVFNSLGEIANRGVAAQRDARTNLGINAVAAIVGGANKLPYFQDMNTAALADLTAFARTLLGKADAAAARSSLGINAVAAIVGGVNKLPYFQDMETPALADLTAFARTLLSRADAATVCSDLGLKSAGLRDVGTGARQIPDMSAFGADLSGNGKMRFPGGLFLQWGNAFPTAGTALVHYNEAFISAPWFIGITTRQADFPTAMQSVVINDSLSTNTQFSARTLAFDGTTMVASTNAFFWYAIGQG